jgi:hypothetical protein
MVIACEALKPPDDGRNCYAVIDALLGQEAVNRIRQSPFPAQNVRSTHLHTGEFHGAAGSQVGPVASNTSNTQVVGGQPS